jgi:hypothetical protein
MALNEVFAPGPACRKLSLGPLVGTVAIGDPVKVGRLNGVVQTAVLATGDADPVTSNAATYATVWVDGAYKLTVTVTGTVKIGDPIFATVTGSNSTVALTNVTGTGKFIFGTALEASAAGTVKITVLLALDAGVALP